MKHETTLVRAESAGTFNIEYQGPEVDALALGTLQLELHNIATRVFLRSLHSDRDAVLELVQRDWPQLGNLFYPDFYPRQFSIEDLISEPLIRLRADKIQSGSLYQEISLYVANILADSHARAAILDSFGGSFIFAIFQSGLRGIKWKMIDSQKMDQQSDEPPTPPDIDPHKFDPYDVGPNVTNIAQQLIANGSGKESALTIRWINKQNSQELKITLK